MVSAITKIEWADATWNPVTGCTPCSPGCDHCYAASMVRRFAHLHDNGTDPLDTGAFPLPFSRIQFHPERLDHPLHWRKPRRIFVCSMGDLFHPAAETSCRAVVFGVMQDCPQHTFMLLTKRPEEMLDFVANLWCVTLPNVWLGVTVCNQAEADAKIPVLLQTPAALRFVSVEPMLGPVDLRAATFNGADSFGSLEGLHWVICGGETGPGARRMKADWAGDLRDQCQRARVPFFFKGWGTWGGLKKTHPDYRRLDGREWHQFPEVP